MRPRLDKMLHKRLSSPPAEKTACSFFSASERYAIFHRFAFRHRADESLNVIAHPQRDRYKPSSKSAADVVQSFPVPNLAEENVLVDANCRNVR